MLSPGSVPNADKSVSIATVIAHADVIIVSAVSPPRDATAMLIFAAASIVIIFPPWVRVPPPAIVMGKAPLPMPVTWMVHA